MDNNIKDANSILFCGNLMEKLLASQIPLRNGYSWRVCFDSTPEIARIVKMKGNEEHSFIKICIGGEKEGNMELSDKDDLDLNKAHDIMKFGIDFCTT